MTLMASAPTNTLTEVERTSVQIRIPKPIWDSIKIQAIRETMSNEQLAAKAFEFYLASLGSGKV